MRLPPAAGVCGTSVDQCKHVQGRQEREAFLLFKRLRPRPVPSRAHQAGKRSLGPVQAATEQALFPRPRRRRRLPLAAFTKLISMSSLCSANGAAGRALQQQLLLVCAKPGRTAGPGPPWRHQAPSDRVAAAAAVRGRSALCGQPMWSCSSSCVLCLLFFAQAAAACASVVVRRAVVHPHPQAGLSCRSNWRSASSCSCATAPPTACWCSLWWGCCAPALASSKPRPGTMVRHTARHPVLPQRHLPVVPS